MKELIESLSKLHPAVACTVVIGIAAVCCTAIWGFYKIQQLVFS